MVPISKTGHCSVAALDRFATSSPSSGDTRHWTQSERQQETEERQPMAVEAAGRLSATL